LFFVSLAEAALNNPLLDDSNIKGAKSILLNIKGGPDMALFEVDEAASKIRNEVDKNANIIFGSSIDDNLEGIIRVSIVATGIDNEGIVSNLESIITEDNLESKVKLPYNTILNQVSENETKLIQGNQNVISSDYKLDKIEPNQIDLESQIDEITNIKDIKETNYDITKEIRNEKDSDNLKQNDKIENIIQNKPENHFTTYKPQNILKRLSTFFIKDEPIEVKVEPNIKREDIIYNEASINKNFSESIPLEAENKTNKSELQTRDDLFENKENENISNQQIDLINIEQNEDQIDENVLEIPAFLRRQAN
jgi:hypothetical protein